MFSDKLLNLSDFFAQTATIAALLLLPLALIVAYYFGVVARRNVRLSRTLKEGPKDAYIHILGTRFSLTTLSAILAILAGIVAASAIAQKLFHLGSQAFK